VREWCFDLYDNDQNPARPSSDPGPTHRVMRGGSFSRLAFDARSSSRSSGTPGNHDNTLGVRPARAMLP